MDETRLLRYLFTANIQLTIKVKFSQKRMLIWPNIGWSASRMLPFHGNCSKIKTFSHIIDEEHLECYHFTVTVQKPRLFRIKVKVKFSQKRRRIWPNIVLSSYKMLPFHGNCSKIKTFSHKIDEEHLECFQFTVNHTK